MSTSRIQVVAKGRRQPFNNAPNFSSADHPWAGYLFEEMICTLEPVPSHSWPKTMLCLCTGGEGTGTLAASRHLARRSRSAGIRVHCPPRFGGASPPGNQWLAEHASAAGQFQAPAHCARRGDAHREVVGLRADEERRPARRSDARNAPGG